MSKEYVEKAALKAQFAADGWLKEKIRVLAYCTATGLGYVKERTVEQVIDSVFPADVKPVVRGEWINRDATFMECSACQALYLKQIDSGLGKAYWVNPNFCPNCGADMRKEKKK